jgi:large conductance mechanosensitive channel
MGFLQEFKAFALKGNVVDMAVGVIIGGAFGKIVTSLVNDIIMPPVGLLVGGADFKDLSWTLKEKIPAVEAQDAVLATEDVFNEAGELIYKVGDVITPAVEAADEIPAVVLTYGNFVQVTVDFLIVAISVFVMIKIFNKLSSIRLKKKQEEEAAAAAAPAPEPVPTKEEVLLTEIRDLLKERK